MAILDAWSYELPVITTPVGGIPDIAIDGDNMLLFTPGNIRQLAEKMKNMIEDVKLRNDIVKESIKFSKTFFDIVDIDNKIGEIYKSLVNEFD